MICWSKPQEQLIQSSQKKTSQSFEYFLIAWIVFWITRKNNKRQKNNTISQILFKQTIKDVKNFYIVAAGSDMDQNE